MGACVGIRVEDKNEWERRTPLIPLDVKELKETHGIQTCVQASPIRAFRESEYEEAGATVVESLTDCDCPTILAIKEIPSELLVPGKTYAFFSHTIKGQKHNMPMLRRLLDLGCQLIDYEKIVDENGRRLVFFGNYAGLAGMIDTFWAFGQRMTWENIETPFSQLHPTHKYATLDEAKAAIQQIGHRIARDGLNQALAPLICGFAGYGNVSRGAQEIFDLLPVREIKPSDLVTFDERDAHHVFKVVFKEEDMVEPVAPGTPFHLQDYYDHPEKYRSKFDSYTPFLTLLINGIYWSGRYPRLVTRSFLKEFFSQSKSPRLKVIGDISCDTEGAIECDLRATTPGDPIYVYDPLTGQTQDGHKGRGVVVLAVDNLPCELPRESSTHFSRTLVPFVPEIAQADYAAPFSQCELSPTIKRAVIAWHGQLTPDFQYLERYLSPLSTDEHITHDHGKKETE
jgi:saccharopine dehydrogenase (NAD+, L-lysine-forming)